MHITIIQRKKRGNQKPEKLKKGQENEYPILWPSSQIFNRDQMNIYILKQQHVLNN